ncbi:MAG TPA: CdaR family protein [Pyrinomonadaceae bacterium]|nr:CdaR family protein [Pyrinomonadaceae bacterium]
MPSTEQNSSLRTNASFLKQILKKIFLEDWLTKLLALAITIALWIGVTGLSEVGSDRYKVPLVLRLADNAEATNQPIDQVEIRISGDKRRLEQIRESDLRVFVDLTSVPVGSQTLTLAPDTVSLPDLPNGIRLDDINPKKIVVRLEAIEEKEVVVRVDTQGSPPQGMEIYEETISPAKIRVRGPASFLRTLTSISTEKVDLADKRADFAARQVRIAPLSNDNATPLDSFVDVNFRIGETRVEKSFTIPIAESKRRAQITLFGGRSLFDGISAKDFSATLSDGSDEPSVDLPGKLDGQVEVRKVRLL